MMGMRLMLGAFALGLAAFPGVALADDPYDPAMRTHGARERDRAVIRRLNQQELARVRERDARYAQGWAAWREHQGRDSGDEADRSYADARADFDKRMAEWRRAVAACREGRYEYCAR